MYKVNHGSSHPIMVDLFINDRKVNMEVDTGAAVTVMSEEQHKKLFPRTKLQPCSLLLKTYTGEAMSVAGQIPAQVRYGDQHCALALTVIRGKGPVLLGRDWLNHLVLDWKNIGLARVQPNQSRWML